MWVIVLLWQSHSEYKRGLRSTISEEKQILTTTGTGSLQVMQDTAALQNLLNPYTVGSWVGIGTVGYTYTSVEIESGSIRNFTVLDHGSVARFYTITDFADSIEMSEDEVKYFMLRFFEWVKLE